MMASLFTCIISGFPDTRLGPQDEEDTVPSLQLLRSLMAKTWWEKWMYAMEGIHIYLGICHCVCRVSG